MIVSSGSLGVEALDRFGAGPINIVDTFPTFGRQSVVIVDVVSAFHNCHDANVGFSDVFNLCIAALRSYGGVTTGRVRAVEM
jgi:hypothetical protein